MLFQFVLHPAWQSAVIIGDQKILEIFNGGEAPLLIFAFVRIICRLCQRHFNCFFPLVQFSVEIKKITVNHGRVIVSIIGKIFQVYVVAHELANRQ